MNKIIYPVTEIDLKSVLASLPEWRLKKALSYRFDIDRFLCAKSYLLLYELLQRYYAVEEMPEFVYGLQGKPELKGISAIHFNISHCKNGIICAVSDSPVGVDIEEIQYHEDLLPRIFSESEQLSIKNSPSPAVKFTELWTRKESYLKKNGVGLIDELAEVSPINTETVVCPKQGFVYSVSI